MVQADIERSASSEKVIVRSEWLPIETAPKDGTRILGFGRGTEKCAWPAYEQMPFMQCVIWWTWHDTVRLVDAGDGLFRKAPERVLEMWQPIGPHFFRPTHWMPLPSPPGAELNFSNDAGSDAVSLNQSLSKEKE